MARLFNHVLLQQTQLEDSQGAITITNMYSTWSVLIFSLPCSQHVVFVTSINVFFQKISISRPIGPKIKILPGSLMRNNAKKENNNNKQTNKQPQLKQQRIRCDSLRGWRECLCGVEVRWSLLNELPIEFLSRTWASQNCRREKRKYNFLITTTTTTIFIRAQKLYRVTLIQERKITKEEGTATYSSSKET